MLFITDSLLAKASEAIKKYKLDYAFNYKFYTVDDTPLTYRQIFVLDTDKLLDKSREEKSGWRRFSFKELIYFAILVEFKKFGIEHKKLTQLRDSFFSTRRLKDSQSLNMIDSSLAITCALGGIEITLMTDSDGNITYFDHANSILFNKTDKPVIRLSLNYYIDKLVASIISEKIPVVDSLKELLNSGVMASKTEKEEKLLEIIRDNAFSVVKVKKINGEISIVYAEKYGTEGNIGTKELERLIESKDFQNIELIRRDGKIVNYKIEETFKL